jgi:alpha-ribazole phosphatase
MGIVVLRHAPVAKQYHKRYLGDSDISIDSSLVDLDALKKIRAMKFDMVLSSPLKRAKETLDLIGFEYEVDNRLKEVSFKEEFELKSFDEISKLDSYDEKYLSSIKSWHSYICHESYEDFTSRVNDILESLPKNLNILLCTHAGVIQKVIELKNMEYQDIGYLEYISIKNSPLF